MRTIGKVFLDDGVRADDGQFTTDPKVTREWKPRRSRLLGVAGSVTQQDFGRYAQDMRLVLDSEQNWITGDFKAYLDSLLLTRNASYAYRDYQGVEATVVVVDFAPHPTFVRDVGGSGVLWEYQLVLDVVELTKLDFATYNGA
jgi:hypothetical protein